jgi:hypothetical protein
MSNFDPFKLFEDDASVQVRHISALQRPGGKYTATHERGRFGHNRFKLRNHPEQIQVRDDRCMTAVLVANGLVRKLKNREDTACGLVKV